MAQKLYEESNIQAIAQAIRDKNGLTTTYKTSEMAAAIAAITTGGGGDSGIPEEAFHISGFASSMFSGGHWDWFIDMYGNKVTTSGLMGTPSMFNESKVTRIPFELNFSTDYLNMANMFYGCKNLEYIPDITLNPTSYFDMSYMFNSCESLENPPYIYNAYPGVLSSFFNGCRNLKSLPVDYADTWNMDRIQTYAYGSAANMFQFCYSLRRFPAEFLKKCLGVHASGYNMIYSSMLYNCYALDEAVNIPVHTKTAITSGCFSNAFNNCYRLKELTFELDPDTNAPYVVEWKSQTIDLTSIGYCNNGSVNDCISYNSGITADKQVKDDATYQALKNDPDWCTASAAYSRYNHDSAVNTINSLPDTSAYGTNTIRFKKLAGEKTDGGAINTLTEAEIAVAAAKGWTVSLS